MSIKTGFEKERMQIGRAWLQSRGGEWTGRDYLEGGRACINWPGRDLQGGSPIVSVR